MKTKDHYPWATWVDRRGMRHAWMFDANGGLLEKPRTSVLCDSTWLGPGDGKFQTDSELIPTCTSCRESMAKWHEDAELIRRSLWLRGKIAKYE